MTIGQPGFAQGDDLGMSRRIVVGLATIMPAANDHIGRIVNDYATDRHFAKRARDLCLGEGFAHPVFGTFHR